MFLFKKIKLAIKKLFQSKKIYDPEDKNIFYIKLNIMLENTQNYQTELVCDRYEKNIYVLKKLNKGLSNEIGYLKRVYFEYTIYKLMNSRYFSKLYHIYKIKEIYYLLYEFTSTIPLKYSTSNNMLDPVFMLGYFKQLMFAMKYLHEKGVAHNSLSLDNVLIDANGNLMITGLENADLIKEPTSSTCHKICDQYGPSEFIAPEIYKNKYYNGMIADIYRCGMIFFYLLVLRLPWEKAVMSDENYLLWYEVDYSDITFTFPLNTEIKWTLKRLLDHNPETRIKIHEIFQLDWFKEIYVLNNGI